MKDKTRVIVMVCFAADLNRLTLAVVGKSKQTTLFFTNHRCKNTLAFYLSKDTWFDRNITY